MPRRDVHARIYLRRCIVSILHITSRQGLILTNDLDVWLAEILSKENLRFRSNGLFKLYKKVKTSTALYLNVRITNYENPSMFLFSISFKLV